MQPINNFQAENQNLVNKIKPNLFFLLCSVQFHMLTVSHVEVLSSVLQTRAARVEWLRHQLSSVAVSRSTSHARQSKMAAGGRVQRGGSQHRSPRWRRGRVQGLPALAPPPGALCSRYWGGHKAPSVKEYLFNNGLG